MKKQTSTIFDGLALIGSLFLGGNVLAQPGTIELSHKAEHWQTVIDDRGVERIELAPSTRVLPGEEVLLTSTYTNTGEQPAEEVTITSPIPTEMVYVQDSAVGDNTSVQFSVDGGSSFAASDELLVTDPDGTERLAGANDYTHVRWVVSADVLSGDSGSVQFAAVVK